MPLKSQRLCVAPVGHWPEATRSASPRCISLEPRIAPVSCRTRRVDNDRATGRHQPLEKASDPIAIHPVQGSPDGHDIECSNVGGQRFRFTFDQSEGIVRRARPLASPRPALPARDRHRRSGRHRGQSRARGSTQAPYQGRSRHGLSKRKPLRGVPKEFCRIGRPELPI